jgi:hypothetical protein
MSSPAMTIPSPGKQTGGKHFGTVIDGRHMMCHAKIGDQATEFTRQRDRIRLWPVGDFARFFELDPQLQNHRPQKADHFNDRDFMAFAEPHQIALKDLGKSSKIIGSLIHDSPSLLSAWYAVGMNFEHIFPNRSREC